MSNSSFDRWLHRFALLLSLSTLALIGVGGLVTSHGVGMAVPDWPNSYGYNMFLFPVSQWVGGILYEHSHRLVASAVGFLTAILAIWIWVRETRSQSRWAGVVAILLVLVLMGVRQLPVYIGLACVAPLVIALSFYHISRGHPGLRWWAIMALAAVILQGVLGGLRVVLFKNELGILHATLAQLFFVLVCAIALFTSRGWQNFQESSAGADGSPSRLLCQVTFWSTMLVLVQLMVGATMRHQHAGLAIPDFPLAYGQLWPAMDEASITLYNQQRIEIIATNPISAWHIGLQMGHRFMAGLIVLGVITCVWCTRRQLGRGHPLRWLAWMWLGMIGLQVLLGAMTIWSNKAADMATAHVLVGAISLATGTMMSIVSFRGLASVNPIKAAPAQPQGWMDLRNEPRVQPDPSH